MSGHRSVGRSTRAARDDIRLQIAAKLPLQNVCLSFFCSDSPRTSCKSHDRDDNDLQRPENRCEISLQNSSLQLCVVAASPYYLRSSKPIMLPPRAHPENTRTRTLHNCRTGTSRHRRQTSPLSPRSLPRKRVQWTNHRAAAPVRCS